MCTICGLLQNVPPVESGQRACCARCGGTFESIQRAVRSNALTRAFALSALILYPLAVGLPMLRIERFGHAQETSILVGVVDLMSGGHLVIGLIVLVCSIVLPLGKLVALFMLSSGGFWLRPSHRAFTYRLVEWTGRWGMLDVLLVAILVAAVKLGDLVDVSAGPAAVCFALVVALSLIAAAVFDPRALWAADSYSTEMSNE